MPDHSVHTQSVTTAHSSPADNTVLIYQNQHDQNSQHQHAIPVSELSAILVVAPHPDDETLGCGGLIALCARARHPISILAMTNGEASHPGDQTWQHKLGHPVCQRTLKDGHAKAHLGAMAALVCSMQSMLRWGAQQIDADPTNMSGQLFPSALLVKHHIERGCTEILDRFGRTLGPRPYAFERDNARRIAELTLYIRQCHAERDLEELGSYLGEHPEFLSNSV